MFDTRTGFDSNHFQLPKPALLVSQSGSKVCGRGQTHDEPNILATTTFGIQTKVYDHRFDYCLFTTTVNAFRARNKRSAFLEFS